MNPSPVQKQTRRWIINAFPLIYPERRNLAVGSDPKKRKRISDQEEHRVSIRLGIFIRNLYFYRLYGMEFKQEFN